MAAFHPAVPADSAGASHPLRDLPALVSVVPAAVLYPLALLLLWLYRPGYHAIMDKQGIAEYFGVVSLLIGIVFGFVALRHVARLPRGATWIRGWIICVMAGMFIIAGEELAWGQNLNLWSGEDLPAWLQSANTQQKSTLHNLRDFPETGIRNLITLAVLIGCLILPGLRWWKNLVLPVNSAGYWFWPTYACIPAAIGVIFIPMPRRIVYWLTDEKISHLRHTEMVEAYIALLLMIYMASIAWRLRQMPARADTA